MEPREDARRSGFLAGRGSVTVVMAGVMVLLGVLGLAMVRVGVASVQRGSAQAAADAAALAGAADGEAAASRIASINGASMLRFEIDGDDVEVRVQLGDAYATARARRRDPPPPVVSILPDDTTALPDDTTAANAPVRSL